MGWRLVASGHCKTTVASNASRSPLFQRALKRPFMRIIIALPKTGRHWRSPTASPRTRRNPRDRPLLHRPALRHDAEPACVGDGRCNGEDAGRVTLPEALTLCDRAGAPDGREGGGEDALLHHTVVGRGLLELRITRLELEHLPA